MTLSHYSLDTIPFFLSTETHLESSNLITFAPTLRHNGTWHWCLVNWKVYNIPKWARRCTVSCNNWWCFVCVFTVVYSRAVSAGRWVSCRGRFLQAERLPAEAGLGWSASATAESMSSVLFSLWPVDQRPVHDLRWTQQQRPILSYSQENIRRQNQPSHLLLATRYVWDEQHLQCIKRGPFILH